MGATEHPILMSGPMVRAILEGRKTQTRRVVKPQPWRNKVGQWLWERRPGQHIAFHPDLSEEHYPGTKLQHVCPYGKAGGVLWVRESYKHWGNCYEAGEQFAYVEYKADNESAKLLARAPSRGPSHSSEWKRWRPTIHMPRWACRIELELTAVRVERVQEITAEDIRAEGLLDDDFWGLWDSLNAKRGYPWSSNPWVWLLSFRKVRP